MRCQTSYLQLSRVTICLHVWPRLVCLCADLLESLTSNRPGIKRGGRLQRNAACGLNLLALYACVQLFRKGPSVCSVIFSQKILQPFNNHQPYVAQTYRDEKSCLGLWGSAGHGKLERGEEENEIKDSLCFCQIFSLPLFAVWELARLLIWWLCADLSIPPVLCSNVDEDQWRQREERRDAAVSSDAHTHTNLQCSRLHSSLSTITPDCTGDSLQYTFYEPFTRFSALVLSLSC